METELEFYLDLVDGKTEKKINDQALTVTTYYLAPNKANGSKPGVHVQRVMMGNFEPPTEVQNFLIDLIGRDRIFEMVMAKLPMEAI
jgi:hypothetical protein